MAPSSRFARNVPRRLDLANHQNVPCRLGVCLQGSMVPSSMEHKYSFRRGMYSIEWRCAYDLLICSMSMDVAQESLQMREG